MLFSPGALLTELHGVVLGGLFLLSYSGGLLGLYCLRPTWMTITGFRSLARHLRLGTWVMAIVAWLTILIGTYILYPPYRAKVPQGADLQSYPKAYLLAHPQLASLHTFSMEWKEHIGWITPIVATAVAYVVFRYGSQLAHDSRIRRALIMLFSLAFLTAAIAGMMGILINKAAPLQ